MRLFNRFSSSRNSLLKLPSYSKTKPTQTPSPTDPPRLDSLFPLYFIISFTGLVICAGSLRTMMDGVEDWNEHAEDGSLAFSSWMWGFCAGSLRTNPLSFMFATVCSVSLSFWSKHRTQHVEFQASRKISDIDERGEGSEFLQQQKRRGEKKSRKKKKRNKHMPPTVIDIPLEGDSRNSSSSSLSTAAAAATKNNTVIDEDSGSSSGSNSSNNIDNGDGGGGVNSSSNSNNNNSKDNSMAWSDEEDWCHEYTHGVDAHFEVEHIDTTRASRTNIDDEKIRLLNEPTSPLSSGQNTPLSLPRIRVTEERKQKKTKTRSRWYVASLPSKPT